MNGRNEEDDTEIECASSPCMMQKFSSFAAAVRKPDALHCADVMRWRRSERERLIAARLAVSLSLRRHYDAKITANLDELLGNVRGQVIGFYWPFRAEPDLKPWATDLSRAGVTFALPVVVERNKPLIFRTWTHGCKMEPGIWNIPIPADGTEAAPNIIVAPVVGFDPACYRLGYGAGYYDRTLAALPYRPRVIGVGYMQSALATIYPQPHDIPMDKVVTEQSINLPALS